MPAPDWAISRADRHVAVTDRHVVLVLRDSGVDRPVRRAYIWSNAMPHLHWDFEPSILLGIALWMAAYALPVTPCAAVCTGERPCPCSRQLAFHLGTLCAFLALVSPLDALADDNSVQRAYGAAYAA